MRHPPIGSVIVAGGGIVGWSAAAALRRQVPRLSVTVVPIPPPPDALADRMPCTLPSIAEFHGDLHLMEADTVVRARSGLRLGTKFEGWAEGTADYVHAYGAYGQPLGPASFPQHWIRAAGSGTAAPFDEHCAAAALAAEGRFAHPRMAAGAQLPAFDYGLIIDPPRYTAMMRALALHLGAVEHHGTLADLRLREDGFVEALVLAGGEQLAADLFVDATGPAALVRGRLDRAWEDWSEWLPADRLLLTSSPAYPEPPALDRAVALPIGWRFEVPSPVRTSHGLVYSTRHCSDDEAARTLHRAAAAGPDEPAIPIRPGCRPEPWLRNCVAIGDAAIACEPLEWINLHLAHSAIDRMVAMLPDRDCAPIELWDYNRQTAAETMRARDFLLLHYAIAKRPSDPFWQDAASRTPPPSLAHTLAQWRSRGRLPFYEEETFSRDSWAAVLIGQGVLPRRTDPLLDAIPPKRSAEAMARLRQAIRRAAQAAPTHADYLRTLSRQVSR